MSGLNGLVEGRYCGEVTHLAQLGVNT